MRDDPDTGFMALAAFRYALGRRSAGPDLVSGWLMRHWGELPRNDRDRLVRELKERLHADDIARDICLEHRPLGDDCDRETWVRFLATVTRD
jgi:hypothetical protein